MAIRLLLFDLDGTLIDSRSDIAAALNGMLVRYGIPPLDEGRILSFVGRGIRSFVTQALSAVGVESVSGPEFPATIAGSFPTSAVGVESVSGDEAVEAFSDEYGKRLLDRTVLYPGVAETLPLLRPARMAVVSNKPGDFIERILQGLGIRPYFEIIIGGDSPAGIKPSPGPFIAALARTAIPASEALVVGDSPYDIAAAKAAGIRCCAALYGFHPVAELIPHEPDFTIETFADLLEIADSRGPSLLRGSGFS
ncbi:MAG: HAD-IA family hydrolase [Bacteroidota bacterium]|nr:HAD-IA family hydrolase [Bacteroidota bacterium]